MTESENENDHFDLDHFDHLKELREANDLTQEQTAPIASRSRRVHHWMWVRRGGHKKSLANDVTPKSWTIN